MRPRALELLCCPRCAGELFVRAAAATDGEEILEGVLACAACNEEYAIKGAVPRLAPGVLDESSQRTVDRFGEQWSDFDFISAYYEQQFLGWIAPTKPSDFKDKVVLEGGCGKGRHSALAAGFGAKDVIAVDLGSAIDTAQRNVRHLPNVHPVQADLFRLPVRPGSVDLAFSVGVLHHTPDPKSAFLELVRRVRPGGKAIAWVYGRENNGWILNVVDPVRRHVTSRLPHRALYHLSKLPAAALYAAIHGVYEPLSKPGLSFLGDRLFYQAYLRAIGRFPFEEVHSIVHDHLTPSIASYIRKEEFERWFEAAGLEEVTIGWHNENSWRGTGRVPERARRTADGAGAELPNGPSKPR